MKKTLILLIISLRVLAQSSTIAPNYIVIPGVASLPSCLNADKGKTVFNTTDNKMYFCDGAAWQSMAGVPSAGVGWAQTGDNISNTNAGNVGIGTSSPTAKLKVQANGVGYEQETSDGSTNFHIKLSGNTAQLRTNTASDIWLSAGRLLPDIRIQSSTGNVGIGSPNFLDEKLTIKTPLNSYGMLHTNDGGSVNGISVGSYLSSIGGAFGTKSNHPFSLFANNSAAALTVKTNADIEITNGFYSAGLGGLNMVPLGVFKVAYELNTAGDLLNFSLTNICGSILTGGYQYSKYKATNDSNRLFLTINSNAIPTDYLKIIVVGTPIISDGPNDFRDIFAGFAENYYGTTFLNDDSRAAFINNGFNIQVTTDAFSTQKINGTFIVYGIK